MKKMLSSLAATGLLCAIAVTAEASTPQEDLELYRSYYIKRFPGVDINDFANGVYAIDEVAKSSWEAIEEFPPYEPAIDEGRAMWSKPFKNGKTYASCFGKSPAVAGQYPQWDKAKGMVVTLALAINQCREANGEEPLKYKKGKIASLLAYMAYESRGQITDVKIPEDDPRALQAYEDGKRFYFQRRGQLNFSCATCHMESTGQHVRTELLSPALGHTTHWPVYRSKWNEMGTLHRRFSGCNQQVRAKAFEAQGEEYRNLEYFLTHISNGLPLNGPGARK